MVYLKAASLIAWNLQNGVRLAYAKVLDHILPSAANTNKSKLDINKL